MERNFLKYVFSYLDTRNAIWKLTKSVSAILERLQLYCYKNDWNMDTKEL